MLYTGNHTETLKANTKIIDTQYHNYNSGKLQRVCAKVNYMYIKFDYNFDVKTQLKLLIELCLQVL